MYETSSSGMSEHDKTYYQQKDHKNYSKTANQRYLASALYDGVEDGNLRQLTTLLINKGANPNIVLPEYGVAPIHLASGLEDIQFGYEAIKLFLSHGGDPNVRSTDGLTPVHIASIWGRNLVLQLLLSNGGDPWLLDNDNKNAFILAHEEQQWETFNLLDLFKNNVVLERPELTKGIRYKLHLDRVKVFNNDICAEYKALPLPLKCCSTQTVSQTPKKKPLSITSADSFEEKGEGNSRKMIPCPPSIDLVLNKSYDYIDDSYNLKFNICPNKQELQALELVKKHRQGITVFEYVPESGYHGDNENITNNNNNRNSRESSEGSPMGSISSLVRGSVFADVKSKLKLFYKNVSSSNGNKECTWRLNLIQKKKDKERLKKQTKGSIKANSYGGNTAEDLSRKNIKETHSDFNNLIAKTPSGLSKATSSNFFRLEKSSEIDYDERSLGSFKIEDSISEVECSRSKKSFSSLWKFKLTEKSKKCTVDKSSDSLSNLESFHRFEDVIDSFQFDVDNRLSAMQPSEPDVLVEVSSSNVDKSSEHSGKCVCQSICRDILRRINSQTFNNNEIGFLANNNNNNNNIPIDCNKKECDNLSIRDKKRDIGFYFDDSVKSVCCHGQEKSSDVKSCITRNVRPHECSISGDINAELSGCKDPDAVSRKKIQSVNQELDDSVMFTEDESTTSKEFFCFKRTHSLERVTQNSIADINNSKMDSTLTSATDIYFSCTSKDHSKEISENRINSDNTNDKHLNETADSNNCLTSKISIHSNSISEKHIEGICVYESDEVSEVNLEDDEECEILNTAFHDSATSFAINKVSSSTPEKEVIYETECFNSLTAVLGSSEQSIFSEDVNVCNSNSPCGDYNLSTQPGPSLMNVNVIPRIKIPDDTSSCSERNIVKSTCNRTNSLQPIEHKWTRADIVSSDDETDVSIIEEYLYTDEEDGVVLVEERHLPTRVVNKITEGNKRQHCLPDGQRIDKKYSGTSTETETESVLSSVDTAYETDELRKELKGFGLGTGPITGGTKRVYLRQLKRARRKPVVLHPMTPKSEFSPELERLLRTEDKDLFENWSHLEIEMSKPFLSPDPTKRWREGVAKTSFTYLLLDPRVTQDLPYRAKSLSNKERLTCFLRAIFYVGRGKRARPYSHLTEALIFWTSWKLVSSKKVKKIHEIWRSGLGVVCLQVFQNIIPAEAMTREAAMIDSLGLQELCNERIGDYYGTASTWSIRQRQQLGAVLLVRALNVLIGEGERQIRPRDIEQK